MKDFAIIGEIHDKVGIAMSDPVNNLDIGALLEGFDHPAILLSNDYQVLAWNDRYRASFGDIQPGQHCYQVSHGYDRPCDQAGESCPMQACRGSKEKERVLHIHNSPRGREHIDVEMLPLKDVNGEPRYFIEVLKPVGFASAEISGEQMVGRSPAFTEMVDLINLVASRDSSVLLLGESGTGKELAAKAIHEASSRAAVNMVTVECAGLTDTLFESELFGHVKGAFTGAIHNKPGLLQEAEGGTLFLDEIGDVPLGMQVKLLRLLETGSYRAVGSTQLKRADFRLVCATNRNLPEMIAEGLFREDLYYRINTFPISLPPLRQRRGDMALLCKSLLSKLAPKESYEVADSAIKALEEAQLPGNIRELRNVLERATIFCKSNVIDLPVIQRCLTEQGAQLAGSASSAPEQWTDLKTQERDYLQRLLAYCGGNKEKAAKIAGISPRSLYRKLEN